MRRFLALTLLLPLFLAALPARESRAGEARDRFRTARDALDKAYFDELDPDKRDRLFEALGAYDNPEAIPAFADVASRFGTYLSGLEGKMTDTQEKLAAFSGRVGLRDQEIGLRNHYVRALEQLEKQWRRARVSEALLIRTRGALRNPKAISSALDRFKRSPTWRVRQLLAGACGYWHKGLKDARTSKKLFAVLKQLGRDKEAGVRMGVARAVSAFKRQEALDLLANSIKDSDWRVRAAAVQSLAEAGKERNSQAVGLLIAAMQKEKGRLADDINKILEEITGEKLTYAESWARWWQSAGEELPAKRPEPTPNAEQPKQPKQADDVRFYGIRTRSDRICFIIDVSGSMNHKVPPVRRVVITGRKNSKLPVEGKTRIEVAKNELKRAISNLSPKKQFMIIYFNHAVRMWRPKMVKATPANKKQARTDIDAMRGSGSTYTLGALREAFLKAGVLHRKGTTRGDGMKIDTIFLLSDGAPTNNSFEEPKIMEPDPILDQVKEWNRDAGIVIHTIAVDTTENGAYFLRTLAAQNGGVFVERK